MAATEEALLDRVTDYEDLVVTRGRRSEAIIVIAIHSTKLGPALGGARLWNYDSPAEAIDDALDLARAMTLKAAAAGLELGGGKGVICPSGVDRPAGDERRALLLDFADAVDSLEGRYITAEDVGTSAEDMAVIAERTSHVVGLPPQLGGSGDPSPITARGVEAAIRACCLHRLGTRSLEGVRVCVIGAGHVGTHLARRLAAAGARLMISDIDPLRRGLADELGAQWIEVADPARVRCEVLAPCAMGGTINRRNVGALRCRIICGSANNMLEDESLASALADLGILYAPDFIANAGGLINVYAELHELRPARVRQMVDSIGDTTGRVIERAEMRSIEPLAAARELARQRLSAGGRSRNGVAATA